MYANIVSADGNAADLKDKVTYNAVSSANFQYKVRPLVKYKEIIKLGFDIDGDEPKVTQATDEDVSAIISKVTTKDYAKKLLTYLVNFYRITNLNMLTKLFAEPFGAKIKTNRDTVTTTFEEDREFDALINTSTKKYSLAQLKTLLAEVIKIAGL